jgi:hypothetical protein
MAFGSPKNGPGRHANMAHIVKRHVRLNLRRAAGLRSARRRYIGADIAMM